MYNRLFTKILDSSIWLEPLPTRVVWITLLAAMDQDGFAEFACAANVARRAGVSEEEANTALDVLLSPDPNSGDPENDGRRLERISGGYLILNAIKYRSIFNREIQREQTLKRVKRHRDRVTLCNASVTVCNDRVTQSEAEAEAEACTNVQSKGASPLNPDVRFEQFWKAYPRKIGKGRAERLFKSVIKKVPLETLIAAVEQQRGSEQWNKEGGQFIPHPATWLAQGRWDDVLRPPVIGNGKPSIADKEFERYAKL